MTIKMTKNSFYANIGDNNILTREVLALIESSQNYIKTGNFLFQDPDVVKAINKASDRGVAVFVLSNIKDPTWENRRDSNKKNSGHVDMHLPNLKELRKHGVHCRGLNDLHAKFILSDGQDGILMSANYSPNSSRRNIETGVRLTENECRDLEYAFDILYANSDIQNLSGDSTSTQIVRTRSAISKDTFADSHFMSDLKLTIASPYRDKKDNTNLIFCNVNSIYQSILSIINGSQKMLSIVTWHFNALDRLHELKNAIRKAIERGVQVRLYSNNQEQNYSLEQSLQAIKELESLGCKSYGDGVNHSKCVLSEKEGVIFTANIDGAHGLKTGFEVGCVLKDNRLDEMRCFVEQLFR